MATHSRCLMRYENLDIFFLKQFYTKIVNFYLQRCLQTLITSTSQIYLSLILLQIDARPSYIPISIRTTQVLTIQILKK